MDNTTGKSVAVKRIINFSGGRTSALMTLLEYNPATDYVVFCDTGREHPKTYKFINDFEAYENIPIVRLGGKSTFDEYLKKNHYNVPNMMKRSCTVEMKIKPARRWARKNIGMQYVNLIGFRHDEPQRVARNKSRWNKVVNVYPLNDRMITKQNVLDFWKQKPYDLEIPSILGNCTLCFMKGKNAIINILKHDPSLALPWIEDERKSEHTYLTGIRIEQLLKLSQQPDLFNQELTNINPAYDCACTT
jgi:hypothetical protein